MFIATKENKKTIPIIFNTLYVYHILVRCANKLKTYLLDLINRSFEFYDLAPNIVSHYLRLVQMRGERRWYELRQRPISKLWQL